MEKLPDKVLIHIFHFLSHREIINLSLVSKKWRMISADSRLWSSVSFRPDHKGLHVSNVESLLALISVRFGPSLKYVELPPELITPVIIHELASKCPNLKHMVLDFASAMQLSDFNDLNEFPCNLYSLTICLSEVIFLEGFMRRIYNSLSSIQVLHVIGTIELSNDTQEEVYEVVNLTRIKAHTPNLRIVNLYGVAFIDDSHIESLSSGCIHLETLSAAFCEKITGESLPLLFKRCKKLHTLLLQNTGVTDANITAVDWEATRISCLDLSSTHLSSEALINVLTRAPALKFLAVDHCENFNDVVLKTYLASGKMDALEALDISNCDYLTPDSISAMIKTIGVNLVGLSLTGNLSLGEQFWTNTLPLLGKVKILVIGTANGWFRELSSRIIVDQLIELLSKHCLEMERLELQWDTDTLRFSDKSSKSIDHIRLKLIKLKSFVLPDGPYYEMVKSNFERAERAKIVRTTNTYCTSIVKLLPSYKDLLVN